MHVAIKPRQRDDCWPSSAELGSGTAIEQLRFMERAEVESLLATKRYCAGLYDTGSGHLHPLNYTLGLAAAAQAAGVTDLRELTPSRICTSHEPAVVRTERGSVRAQVRRAVL